MLASGSSLLVHGVGSKAELLNDFCATKLAPHLPCLVLKGFSTRSSGLDLSRELIGGVCRCLRVTVPVGGSLAERWRTVVDHLERARGPAEPVDATPRSQAMPSQSQSQSQSLLRSERDDSLEAVRGAIHDAPARVAGPNSGGGGGVRRSPCCYVVIHSIDGINLRASEVQTLLSNVAAVPEVRMVASIDDVHTPSMWSKEMVERFQWWWIHCDTYAPFSTEVTAGTPSRRLRIAGPNEAYERAMKTLNSLPKQARAAFRALCAHMLVKGVELPFTVAEWGKIDTCANLPPKRYARVFFVVLL